MLETLKMQPLLCENTLFQFLKVMCFIDLFVHFSKQFLEQIFMSFYRFWLGLGPHFRTVWAQFLDAFF